MIARLWRWLVRGSDDLYLPPSWLANEARLAAYDNWTQRQRDSYVVSDVATMRRKAFRAQTEALRQEQRDYEAFIERIEAERRAEQARVVWGRFA